MVTPGADLDLTAMGGIVTRKKHSETFWGMASLHATERTYVYMTIDELTRVKNLKQNNMPVFVISSKFIYYIVTLQISSNLLLNGQNVSDTVLTVTTNNKKMVEIFFSGGNAPPCPSPLDSPLGYTKALLAITVSEISRSKNFYNYKFPLSLCLSFYRPTLVCFVWW